MCSSSPQHWYVANSTYVIYMLHATCICTNIYRCLPIYLPHQSFLFALQTPFMHIIYGVTYVWHLYMCVVLYIHICQCIPSPSPVLMHGPLAVTIGARVPRTQRPRPGPPRTTSTAGVIWNKKDCESLSMANACAHTRTYRATSVFLVVGIVWCCLGALFWISRPISEICIGRVRSRENFLIKIEIRFQKIMWGGNQ